GYFLVAFQPSSLNQRPDIPLDANLVLIDTAGQLFYASDSDEELKSVAGDEHVERVLAGEIVQVNNDPTVFDEGNRYGSIVPIESMGWAVGYTRSMSELNSALLAGLLEDLAVLAAIMAFVIVA